MRSKIILELNDNVIISLKMLEKESGVDINTQIELLVFSADIYKCNAKNNNYKTNGRY